MGSPFEYFVVFAEMRTGSNFLETNLNEIDGLTCYGEAFNPNFIGYPNIGDLCGITLNAREADPLKLIEALKKDTEGLAGFRFFNDHDHRVFDHVMSDPACAKVVLTRNPVESFVSRKIAAKTGQWKLTEMKHRRDAIIRFDPSEFDRHLTTLQMFQLDLQRRLQTSGQSAFYIGYEDLHEIDVLNGLAAFLGVDGRLRKLSSELKKQNPSDLRAKVANFDEMEAALSRTDFFGLNRTPNFEPPRQAAVPSYVAGAKTPVLYMPVRSGPSAGIRRWMAELDGAEDSDLRTDFTQKSLRQWKRKHPGHRSFSVLRHPVERTHDAFCRYILATGPGTFTAIRRALIRTYKIPLPEEGSVKGYDAPAHRAAFLAFLTFLKGNLSGQTSIRVDPVWASQSEVLKGFSSFAFPDLLLREAEIEVGLAQLSAQLGVKAPPYHAEESPGPVSLREIYDDEIEAAARGAYQRDYVMFGFSDWG